MSQTRESAAWTAPLRAMLRVRDCHYQLPQHECGQADREDREQRIAEQSFSELRQRTPRSVRLLAPHGREQCKETDRKVQRALGDVSGMAGPAFPSRKRAAVAAGAVKIFGDPVHQDGPRYSCERTGFRTT